MDPTLRTLGAATTFLVVAGASFFIGLQFMTPPSADFWPSVTALGVLGVVVVATAYGPLLVCCTLLGGVLAGYVYRHLGPSA